MSKAPKLLFERTVDRTGITKSRRVLMTAIGRVNASPWREFKACEMQIQSIALDPAPGDRITVRIIIGQCTLTPEVAHELLDTIELNELYLGELIMASGCAGANG